MQGLLEERFLESCLHIRNVRIDYMIDLLVDFGTGAGPIGEVDNVYRAPVKLDFPGGESVDNSPRSSAPSSPTSSISANNLDSESDFAGLAENLAIKSDAQVSFCIFLFVFFSGNWAILLA